ncbi:MAG TPA: hypothetical protein VN721_00735, partial [Flavipsychrobacter sp.]|nr:hypothetical protein [Flavipsychrobacter sp.]
LADNIRRKLTLRRIAFLHKFSAVCILLIGVALFISTTFNIQFKKHEHEQSTYHQYQLPKIGKPDRTLVSLQPHV